MTNEQLYEKALEAITNLFNDESVTIEKAKENLEGLIDEIGIMIDSFDVN